MYENLSKEEYEQLIFEQKQQKIRNYLEERLKTKMKTCFIGSIAAAEEYFGHLWDQAKENDEVEGPEFYKNLFFQYRKRVLDNGNNQIRNLNQELDKYNFSFKTNYYKVKE